MKALKAVVRIQAIFRGQQVRKQAAVTLRCMQALVKIQARVRAHCVRISPEEEEQAVQKLLNEHQHQMDPLKEAEVFSRSSCTFTFFYDIVQDIVNKIESTAFVK